MKEINYCLSYFTLQILDITHYSPLYFKISLFSRIILQMHLFG